MIDASVIDIRKVGTDKAVIKLRPAMRFPYIAGQYVELTFDGCEPRFYSIANAPSPDDFKIHDIEVHIKDNGKGGAASHAINSLTHGDNVILRGPFGESTWRPSLKKPLLLVAGGLGIAPMKALAEDALANKHPERVILYWGVANLDDRYYVHEELKDLASLNSNLRYESLIGTPVSDIVASAEKNLGDFDIYLAGPPDMIRMLVPRLIENNAHPEAIYCDHSALLKSVLNGDLV
jgi:NAD(P)H-flavin reductase